MIQLQWQGFAMVFWYFLVSLCVTLYLGLCYRSYFLRVCNTPQNPGLDLENGDLCLLNSYHSPFEWSKQTAGKHHGAPVGCKSTNVIVGLSLGVQVEAEGWVRDSQHSMWTELRAKLLEGCEGINADWWCKILADRWRPWSNIGRKILEATFWSKPKTGVKAQLQAAEYENFLQNHHLRQIVSEIIW